MIPNKTSIFKNPDPVPLLQKLVSMAVILFTAFSADAQWSLCNPVGYSPRQAISVVGNGIIYAGGNDGKVWKSVDDGNTWTVSSTDTTKSILGMCFLNSDTGFVCGVAGKMFKTVNGGTSWSSVNSGVVVDLYDIEFISPSTGFAVGLNGTIRKTTNGGLSWSPMSSGTSSNLLSIDMVSGTRGFITGSNGTILSTVNGSTWSQQTTNIISAINDIRSLDGTTAFACGSDARLLVTSNGGSTWQASYLDSTYSDLYSVDFAVNDTGWIAGQYGKIFVTFDGGTSWSPEAGATGSLLLDLKAVSGCKSTACGTGGTVVLRDCNFSGIDFLNQDHSPEIFPNPACDRIMVRNSDEAAFDSFQISDLSGKVLLENDFASSGENSSIDIHQLPAGIYVMKLTGRETFTKRIIIQK